MKAIITLFFLFIAFGAMAQSSARSLGNSIGLFIAGFLIVFLGFKYIIKPLLTRKK